MRILLVVVVTAVLKQLLVVGRQCWQSAVPPELQFTPLFVFLVLCE